jgi:hypothetical protein
VNEEIISVILSHAEWNHDQFPLDRPIRKTLFAVDELCGFRHAVGYVRPEKLTGMIAANSVRKKMKQGSFAAAVKREDIEKGARVAGSCSTSTSLTSSLRCRALPRNWVWRDRRQHSAAIFLAAAGWKPFYFFAFAKS